MSIVAQSYNEIRSPARQENEESQIFSSSHLLVYYTTNSMRKIKCSTL